MPSFKTDTCDKSDKGTVIELTKLKRKTNFDIEELSYSLSKIFNFSDEAFKLFLYLNNGEPIEIDNKLKYENITPEFEWTIPQFGNTIDINYEEKGNVKGKIITTEKPLKPGLRGITLFANGRMINKPEFFSSTESSHFFSYTIGWLDVDFVDNWEEDVISTNRQSINWENDKTIELRIFLKELLSEIQKDWRTKRKEKRTQEINEKTDIDIEAWYSHLPEHIRKKVEPLIFSIVNNSELPPAEYNKAVTTIHEFVPDYPYFHWRHLHPIIQAASESDYQNKDYYRAFIEAAKRYITATRSKSGSSNMSDSGMMGEVFGRGKSLLVSKNYKKPDGSNFNQDTYESIEDGQKFLSMGIVAGGRNPVSHEEIKDLRDSGLFTEKDCLDGLSLLSHLLRRLEDA